MIPARLASWLGRKSLRPRQIFFIDRPYGPGASPGWSSALLQIKAAQPNCHVGFLDKALAAYALEQVDALRDCGVLAGADIGKGVYHDFRDAHVLILRTRQDVLDWKNRTADFPARLKIFRLENS
jgi:hypothetical protein